MTHHLPWPTPAGFPGEAMDVASADPGPMDLQQYLSASRSRVGPFGGHKLPPVFQYQHSYV
jgi:hypothetical protein